jgi:SAM-dependent methyltransferase
MTLFAATIFLGSFLLFQIELIIARIILPWFGGAAAVWTTCLLFFQIMLLLGYLYAHGLTRYIRPKSQFLIHLVLLGAAAFLLPVLPGVSWKPSGTEEPLFRILVLLTAVVGLPFFLLSSTSPLLSYWFARAFPGSSPYRLYALSNLGSMLGLLTYPTLVEPYLPIRAQAYGWSGAFLAFSALFVVASRKGTFAQNRALLTPPGPAVEVDATPSLPPAAGQWFFWIALPACGSVLLLGVTNHLTQNVASIPFLWVLPLSLYLLSFTLAFWGPALYPRAFYMPLLALSILGMDVLFSGPFVVSPLKILLPVFCIGMFAGCMVCHGELARLAPDPRYLTPYYLAIAAGGGLGGIFVGVAAPLFFRTTYELPLGIAACAILALISLIRKPGGNNGGAWWQRALLILASGISIVVVVSLMLLVFQPPKGYRLLDRNFYGVLKVVDRGTPGDRNSQRILSHGSINHGAQFLQSDRRLEPITYFHPDSGVGLAIRSLGSSNPLRVGIIGLGAGIIAAYGRTGDVYRFYEINPLVVEIANTDFTYLRDSLADVEVILGDGRLSLEREPQQKYNVLIADAFSGDAIPIHLLTREAIQLYLRHLKKDGILALQISNRYIDLKPVIQRLAENVGMEAMAINTAGNPDTGAVAAEWVLLSAAGETLEKPPLPGAGKALQQTPDVRMWTDDYSSLFRLLK